MFKGDVTDDHGDIGALHTGLVEDVVDAAGLAHDLTGAAFDTRRGKS
jgi:hypothetical protein